MALAQQAAAPVAAASDLSAGLEEITVTARKREEKLQDVPLAISVITQKSLQDLDITRIEDIARFVPGFHVDDTGDRAFNKPFIRGITTSSVEGYQAKVKTFIDGVLVAGDSANSVPFSELASVEILKGPQSTAFGRGVLGGAIDYRTVEPTNYLSGSVSAEVRQLGETAFNGFLSGPIIEDVLKGYINVRDYNYSGFLTNTYDGSKLGSEQTRYVSTKLVYTPADWLKVTGYASFDADRDSLPAFQFGSPNLRTNISTPASLAVTGGKPIIVFTGPLEGVDFKGNTYGPDNQLLDPGLKRESYRTALNAAADLGFATLTSVTAYNQSHERASYNTTYGLSAAQITGAGGTAENPGRSGYALDLLNQYGFGALDSYQTNSQEMFKDFQQELRLTSNDDGGPLKWLAGFNYFNTRQFENYPVFSFNQTYTTNSYSGFGLISYDILENLTLTAEGRWNDDQEGLNAPYYKHVFLKDYYRFQPRISLSYKVMPDILLYTVFSEGTSPGFFNANATGAFAKYTNVAPEYLYNYEIGAKSTWFDRQLQANIALYEEDYKNEQLITQLSVLNPFYNPASAGSTQYSLGQYYTNAASAKSQGVELELNGAPEIIPGLKLHADMAWNRAVFENYCSAVQYLVNPFTPPPGNSTAALASSAGYTGCVSVAGHYLQEQPEWMGAMGASYTRPLTDYWTLATEVDWSYIGRKFTDETNLSWTAPSEIVNLHVGVESADYKIDAFVMNLTGEDAPAYGKTFSNQSFLGSATNRFAAFLTQGVAQKPRQFGVKVTYTFGAPAEAGSSPAAYTPPPVVAPAPMARSYMVFFDFNKSDLTPQAVTIVDQAAKNAGPAKVTKLEVTGHTDTVGSEAYNMRLSRRRAESVAAQLEKDGIPSSEIEIVAKGKRDLLVPTADGVKEPQNRRVQIVYEGGQML